MTDKEILNKMSYKGNSKVTMHNCLELEYKTRDINKIIVLHAELFANMQEAWWESKDIGQDISYFEKQRKVFNNYNEKHKKNIYYGIEGKKLCECYDQIKKEKYGQLRLKNTINAIEFLGGYREDLGVEFISEKEFIRGVRKKNN